MVGRDCLSKEGKGKSEEDEERNGHNRWGVAGGKKNLSGKATKGNATNESRGYRGGEESDGNSPGPNSK